MALLVYPYEIVNDYISFTKYMKCVIIYRITSRLVVICT